MSGPRTAPTKLLVDAMCGKLTRYLRMCGYDAAYVLERDLPDDESVLATARAEGRQLVTRNARLAARADDAVLLESTAIEGQLAELRAAGFALSLGRPERCGRCNGPLRRVAPGESTPGYAPDAAGEPVWRCAECGQHFWRGSHWDDVAARFEE